MKTKKGDEYVCSGTGNRATITHFNPLSIGWREDGQKTTSHTCHDYFFEQYRKFLPKANNQINTRVKRTIARIGGIGSFNKIIIAIEGKSRVAVDADKFRRSLSYLVEVGELHYFAHSDTYMITGGEQ